MIQTDWASKAYLQSPRKGSAFLRWAGALLFTLFWLGLFNLGAGV